MIRGGTKLGDQPAAIDAPHLDYSQNDSERQRFHEVFPPNAFEYSPEVHILLGRNDTADEQFRVMLGVWKPLTDACRHPLALMDGRTFDAAHECPYEIHIDLGVLKVHNLNGAITYDPRQRWCTIVTR